MRIVDHPGLDQFFEPALVHQGSEPVKDPACQEILRRVKPTSGVICFDEFAHLFPEQIVHTLGPSCDKLTQAPSHDIEGDCGTTLALRFETTEACRAFEKNCKDNGLGITVPIDTGKHIYTEWTQIMERRGALHPAMDPFKMKENQGLQMDYTKDMCPKTLDYLARTAYIGINPDWTEEELNNVAKIILDAAPC